MNMEKNSGYVGVMLVLGSFISSSLQATMFCTPDTSSPNPTDPPLPTLPDQYQTIIEGNIKDRNFSVTAHEYFDNPGDRAMLSMLTNHSITTLVFDYANDQLFYVKGDSCKISDLNVDNNNLLFGNIDVKGVPHVFSTGGALHFARQFGERYKGRTVVRGIAVDHWQSCFYWAGLQSNFTLDYYFTVRNWTDPDNYPQIPVRAVAKGVQNTGDGPLRNFEHYYDYVDFRPIIEDYSVFETPEGVVCVGRKVVRPVPQLPRFFHYRQEIYSDGDSGVEFVDIWYDGTNKLVRTDSRASSSNLPLYHYHDAITQIDDFNYGLRYIQNQLTGQCNAEQLNGTMYDVASSLKLHNNSGSYSLQMMNSQQFFILDSNYSFSGQRMARGLLCNVYTARKSQYLRDFPDVIASLEYYFLDDSIKEYPDDGIAVSNDVPILLVINIDALSLHTTYNFLDFDAGRPDLSLFDISSCYSESSKLQFQVTFQGQFKTGVLGQLRSSAHAKFVASTGVSAARIQEVKIDYDHANIYISAKLLDRSPYTAQFTFRAHKEIQLHDDLIIASPRAQSVADCAKACVLNTNFTCNSYDFCSSDPVHICRLSKAHIDDGTAVVINSTCDHYSRTVNGPVKPELNVTQAYSKLTNSVFSGQLQINAFIPYLINPITYKAIDVSVTFGRLYAQGQPQLNAQFSYHLENSIPNVKQVFNSHIWYDFQYQLVRYDVMNGVPMSNIHDYNNGLAYQINRVTQQCTVSPIGNHSFDVTAPSGSQLNKTGYVLRMKNPLQLFDLTQNFQYKGQKTIRGIMCDVYENVNMFYFGERNKQAIFQFYFMTRDWHELSEDSGIPVPNQPISLIITAADASESEHFDIYDFSEQHPDLTNFDIRPCFQKITQQTDFVIKFNQSYHPYLNTNLALFQKNVQEQLSVLTGVSPLRFQNPQITSQGLHKTLYLATMVQQAPFILDFTKTSNTIGLYSMDASFPGVASDDQCAGICRNMTAFQCQSFDYCPSTKLCQLSKVHIPDGNHLTSSTTCDHYSKTVTASSTSTVEPTINQTLTMLQDRIARGTLIVKLQISPTTVISYKAVHLGRSILIKDSSISSSTTLNHFSRKQNQRMSYPTANIKMVSVDECAARCLSQVAFNCESYSYCPMIGLCTLQNIHPDQNVSTVHKSNMCDLYSRRYTDSYVKYQGQSTQTPTGKQVPNSGSAEICAKQCSTNTAFACKSFDYCSNSRTCYLKTSHILDISKAYVTASTVCSHYSKSYLHDFASTPNKTLTTLKNGQRLTFNNVSSENCAKLCVQNSGYLCKSFTYCHKDTSCTIVSAQTNLVQSQIKSSTSCDLYTRQYFPPVGVPTALTQTAKSTTGYSAGAMGAIAGGMLLPGMVLGAAILYFMRTKKLVEQKHLHEMNVVNKVYENTESDS